MPLESTQRSRRATYQDVVDAPADVIAELVDGRLYTSRRLSFLEASVRTLLGVAVARAYEVSERPRGGWWILPGPELHLGNPDPVLVPDWAGWRAELDPGVLRPIDEHVPPAWVCEVVSPSSARFDCDTKVPTYARFSVRFLWLVYPAAKLLEAYVLEAARWKRIAHLTGPTARARVAPFEEVELDFATIFRAPP